MAKPFKQFSTFRRGWAFRLIALIAGIVFRICIPCVTCSTIWYMYRQIIRAPLGLHKLWFALAIVHSLQFGNRCGQLYPREITLATPRFANGVAIFALVSPNPSFVSWKETKEVRVNCKNSSWINKVLRLTLLTQSVTYILFINIYRIVLQGCHPLSNHHQPLNKYANYPYS